MKKLTLYKSFLIAAIPLLFQACFVAKDYKREEALVPQENLFRTDAIPQDSLSMAEVSWRELFTDPILASYIEEGLQNNLDIRIALQQILAAEAYVNQGKSGYLPTLGASTGVSRQEFSKNSNPNQAAIGNFTQYEVAANLSWEADIWGKIRSNKRAFDASYLQSVAAHQAVKTRLIASIATTYYQLLALDEQRKITLETIDTRSESLETTQALKEAGNLTEVGVKQTEAQLNTAKALLLDIENQIRVQENSLSILLGQAPQALERGSLENQIITSDLNIGIPAQLLSNRPDILEAEYNLINAFELTNVAKSNFYPSLQITASGGFQSLDLEKLFDVNSLFASMVGSLTQPIFNGRRIRTEYEVSQARQEEAKLNFQRALLNAGKEVSDALYAYQYNTQKIEVKSLEFDAYNKATGYSEELLDNGLVNYLEVLIARQNSLNSQIDMVNAKFSQLEAMVELYRALGGGWR
ncbi:efflux transporter outer membrane subunit [Gillisia sp. M10.2A]|uniref:Efflux transporter outer membrane subunit n=1 Tax=Gillisia lutea TaxID=2909668 RepID=A0ABS9ECN0_9FLAO|nr:efflux transporter outer membrane subunit [Gillisia lutea]MCF4100543.1 efflux transporter outer membrane subunit [Gillisia lutea]